ncbi:MAG: ArsR family transcriptional regulator [Candidatus Nanohalobium sp.]
MPKKRNYEIKNSILESLENYAKNSSQLSKEVGTGQKTVEKHLKELESLGEVREMKTRVNNKEKWLWERI